MSKFKLLVLFFITLCWPIFIWSQARNDYFWILGYPPNHPMESFGGVLIDFNQNRPVIQYFDTKCHANQPAVLSSSTAELLAYSNGCRIFDSEHNLMTNGDSLSYGEIWDTYCEEFYPGTQDRILLPWPDDSLKAVLFYMKVEDNFSTHILMYSIIEFNTKHPLGIVTSRDNVLLNPGTSALITATRHGNGRDWWLILPENATNRFFKILLEPSGISVVDTQSIGQPWGGGEWASQAIFTPDGSKYIRNNPWKGLDIFNFDRCLGILSNPIESGALTDPILVGCGAGVSVDSRYLYISNVYYLFQYDLWDPDILSTKMLIDTFDGYSNPFPTTFYQMTLAPDGRIYIFSNNGVKSVHVINHPERKGHACGFIQHGLELPAYVSIGSPNIPYFRSGPVVGSGCDTLEISKGPIADFRYEIDSLMPYRVRFKDMSYYHPEAWHWDFGTGLFAEGSIPPEIDFGSQGTYPVCLTVSNIYGDYTFCRTVTIGDTMTSVFLGSVQSSPIRTYPNPAGDRLTIESLQSNVGMEITFYSAQGVKVFAKILTSSMEDINISLWPPGFYAYTLKIEGETRFVGKIIKQ